MSSVLSEAETIHACIHLKLTLLHVLMHVVLASQPEEVVLKR